MICGWVRSALELDHESDIAASVPSCAKVRFLIPPFL
jgi:hypothetical protein